MMWGFGIGWIWMILVWIVIIGAIVWAVARLSPGPDDHHRDASNPDSARRILDDRFARGEIDVDEFRRLRDELAG